MSQRAVTPCPSGAETTSFLPGHKVSSLAAGCQQRANWPPLGWVAEYRTFNFAAISRLLLKPQLQRVDQSEASWGHRRLFSPPQPLPSPVLDIKVTLSPTWNHAVSPPSAVHGFTVCLSVLDGAQLAWVSVTVAVVERQGGEGTAQGAAPFLGCAVARRPPPLLANQRRSALLSSWRH